MDKAEYHRQYYASHKLDSMIEKTNRRMEILQIMRDIRDIDNKLRVLKASMGLDPAQEATDEELPAVHPAPIPDQEN